MDHVTVDKDFKTLCCEIISEARETKVEKTWIGFKPKMEDTMSQINSRLTLRHNSSCITLH